MYKEKIINVQTGEETWRDYTTEEIAQVESIIALNTQKQTELQIKQEQDVIAKQALLDKLGITADEAKLLLS